MCPAWAGWPPQQGRDGVGLPKSGPLLLLHLLHRLHHRLLLLLLLPASEVNEDVLGVEEAGEDEEVGVEEPGDDPGDDEGEGEEEQEGDGGAEGQGEVE